MFGGLDFYRDTEPESWSAGTLLLPEGRFTLKIAACMTVPASDSLIFSPGQDTQALREYILSASESSVPKLLRSGSPLLAMATCSDEYTNARTAVIAVLEKGD